MKKRIGNDISFVWHIYRKSGDTQVPESFADKDVTIKLISPLQRPVTIEDVTIATGVVTFTFKGKYQVTLGNYVAVLQENRGEDGMVTLDVVDAVTLVPHSYMEEDGDEGDVIEAEAVELTSTISAGGGGGIEQQQADWAQTDDTAVDYIKNKPNLDVYCRKDADNAHSDGVSDTFAKLVYDERNPSVLIQADRLTVGGDSIKFYHSHRGEEPKELLLQLDDVEKIKRTATTELDGLMSAADKQKITDIEAVIPEQASSSNQLADKDFVNSSIATNTATYRGSYNLVSDLHLSVSATQQQIATALATKMAALSITPDNNDYCFVQIPTADATPTEIARIDRYKYDGTAWAYEYSINNSSFTAEQWAAINSSITSGLVTKLSALPTNSELKILLNGKANASDVYTKTETYNKTEVDNLITTSSQQYVSVTATAQTTAVTDLLPAIGKAGTIYRVGNWDGTQYNDSVFSEYAWNGSAYIKLSTKSQVGEIYDISANHADTKYSDLATALGANGANIPQSLRKGGMSIKFVQSSDNKYVQYRLMSDTFNTTVANWQGVDDKPTAGSENLVKSGGAFDYTKSIVPFVATSNTLADAIAEVPTKERYVGKFVEFTDANGNHQKYKYMGKYYTDEDWNSVASATTFGAWLDLNNADKYRVYYFRLTPTKEGTILGDIDSNGDITTGTREVSDYIEIPEGGVTITGGWYARYVLYDENKTKLSSALLYGGKTFSRTDGRYVRAVGALNWKIGVEKGSASTTYPRKPHVEVVENYEDLIDYNDADGWGADYSPYIRLKKGETVRVCDKNGNPIKRYISYQQYDIDYNISGQEQVRMSSFTMSIDGYVKIGGGQKAQKIAAACRLSKSLSITTAKKRLLVVGDSISIYTYSSELSTDVAQGYPYFTAIEGEHEISVTNQAVSGNACSAQFTALQSRDLSVYDAITILIGTNDYGYNSTVTAFKTNLKTMVEYIIAQKPSIKIGLLTLIHRASAWDNTNNTEIPNAAGALLSQFSQAIREVGQEYSIPVLDLWNECQCNFNYETYVANYSSTASNTDGDGLHPTNEAHKMFIYPLYREFIKRLFAE